MRSLLPIVFALASGMVSAQTPYCAIDRSCVGNLDTCVPHEGRAVITALDAYKATVQMDQGPKHEGTYLIQNGLMTMIFMEGEVSHQVRIKPDGAFSYLISKPDLKAYMGKDQILYLGQCLEG